MPRNVTSSFRQAVYAQNNGKVISTLLDIYHPDIDAGEWPGNTIRINNTGTTLTHNGNDYLFYGFELNLPPETENNIAGNARITIDNVDQWLTETVRNVEGEPQVTITLVWEDEPDAVQAQTRPMELVEVAWDSYTITGTLSYEYFFSEPYPGDEFDPETTPALF